MKKIQPKTYARVLYGLTEGKRGTELNKIIERFAAHLARARLLKQSDLIINEFARYAKTQEGIVEIEIQSARELAAATVNQVKKVFGEKVEANSVMDESLLGGVVVRAKDRILDGSLRTQLNNLKMKLST